MNNVFLLVSPKLNVLPLQTLLEKTSDLDTSGFDILKIFKTLWPQSADHLLSFTFVVATHIREMDELSIMMRVNTHFCLKHSDGVLLLITNTLDMWVYLCKKHPKQTTLQQVQNHIINQGYGAAFQ